MDLAYNVVKGEVVPLCMTIDGDDDVFKGCWIGIRVGTNGYAFMRRA